MNHSPVAPGSASLPPVHRTHTQRDSPRTRSCPRESPGKRRSPRESPGVQNSSRDSLGIRSSPRDSPGLRSSPRDSPGVRRSPKSRGSRVTFDGSRRSSSSSPRSRSREKDEEAFRSTVAQNLSLSTESSPSGSLKKGGKSKSSAKVYPKQGHFDKQPKQNLKGGTSPIQKLRDKFIADNTTISSPISNNSIVITQPNKSNQTSLVYSGNSPINPYIMSSRCDDGYDTPERDVVPTGPYVPSPNLDPPYTADPAGVGEHTDGMSEYAAGYNESSEAFRDGGLTANPEGSVSNRRELREPDGASGSSSPAALPLAPSKADNRDSKQGTSGPSTARKSGGDVEAPLIQSPDPKKVDTDSKAQQPDVPYIPSTNIAVAFLVTVCFNLPLGCLAVYFSLMATKAYRDGNKAKGAKKARISIYISLFSIVLTVLIVMAVVLYKAIEGQARQREYGSKSGIRL